MKIPPVGVNLFHADGQIHRQMEGWAGGHDKAIQLKLNEMHIF
jgi:hypothetical protein